MADTKITGAIYVLWDHYSNIASGEHNLCKSSKGLTLPTVVLVRNNFVAWKLVTNCHPVPCSIVLTWKWSSILSFVFICPLSRLSVADMSLSTLALASSCPLQTSSRPDLSFDLLKS